MTGFDAAAALIVVATSIQTEITLSPRQIAEQDRQDQRQADALATRPLPRTERSPGSGPARDDPVDGRWAVVSSNTLVGRQQQFGGPLRDKAHYRVRTRVDYDQDGRSDIAELVENRQRAGIRVTYAGPPRLPDIIFSMPGRWGREELLFAGRRRLYLTKPELGYSVFLRRGRRDEVYHVGD